MHTLAGTQAFMAPEIEDGAASYNKSVDVFSLGAIILALEQATEGKELKPAIEDEDVSVEEIEANYIALSLNKRKRRVETEGGHYIKVFAPPNYIVVLFCVERYFILKTEFTISFFI